jgi:BON domain
MTTKYLNRVSHRGTNQIRAFVGALVVAAALPGCAVFPQSSNPAADQKITADVETRFGQHADLEAPNAIDVQTINRVVYLNGMVATGFERSTADSIAAQAPGVENVVDSIGISK